MIDGLLNRIASHPHGCVSWNCRTSPWVRQGAPSHPHGCVSWNDEKDLENSPALWSHPHGCVSWNCRSCCFLWVFVVTPSRVCELKWLFNHKMVSLFRHTLTGVWVEILHFCRKAQAWWVTPSRVCELKWQRHERLSHVPAVTPSRVCELK